MCASFVGVREAGHKAGSRQSAREGRREGGREGGVGPTSYPNPVGLGLEGDEAVALAVARVAVLAYLGKEAVMEKDRQRKVGR